MIGSLSYRATWHRLTVDLALGFQTLGVGFDLQLGSQDGSVILATGLVLAHPPGRPLFLFVPSHITASAKIGKHEKSSVNLILFNSDTHFPSSHPD
jgi:hypothetical protein